MPVFGVLCIVLGLVLLAAPFVTGPPGTRGRAPWPAQQRLTIMLVGAVGVALGLFLLLSGG